LFDNDPPSFKYEIFLNFLIKKLLLKVNATEEKTVLEDEQREAVKERKKIGVEWVPRLFEQVNH